MGQRVYLATKFIIPTVSKEIVIVKRFLEKIKKCGNFPLTIIKAGAGYGKSTMLGFYFKNFAKNYHWFNISGEDNELYNFLFDLVYCVRVKHGDFGTGLLKLLDEIENLQDTWNNIINGFINELWDLYGKQKENIFLVIEDFHLIEGRSDIINVMTYLLNNLPPGIHVVISTRTFPVTFPWQRWKVKGQVLLISEEDLAFDEQEIRDFFSLRSNVKLEQKELTLIMKKTEGWAMALEMLSASADAFNFSQLEDDYCDSSQDLFAFLAADVLDKQEKEIQHFLLSCSVLNFINKEICEHLLGPNGRGALRKVIEKGLFIYNYGRDNYRFHSLFKEFLYQVAQKEQYPIRQLHNLAADYFLNKEDYEQAVNHLIKAGEYGRAAHLIIEISDILIKGARFNTLLYWLKKLPEDTYTLNPWLFVILGDIYRFTSEFNNALNTYEKAEKLYVRSQSRYEISEVLQRKALVFLDTVQPSRAAPLLNEALALKGNMMEWKKGYLLELIAENNLNRGKIEEVKTIQELARSIGTELPVNLQGRFLLRTGRLDEAITYLEGQLQEVLKREDLSPKAHREVKLILSLLYSLTGKNGDTAFYYAREGLENGQRVGSPFTESVASARLGHTYLVKGKFDKAISWYQNAVRLSERVRVPRGKGEPLWGLCLAYGHKAQGELAFRYGEEAKKICLDASDHWLVALITIAQGISFFTVEDYETALGYFLEAKDLAGRCQDSFLTTVALLWEALVYLKTRNQRMLKCSGEELFTKIKGYNYTFLLKEKTIFSPIDMALLRALTRECFDTGIKQKTTGKPDYHPGYTLYFKTLGDFRVWRGQQEIKSEEWIRDKARKLLQILILYRGRFVRFEELIDILWPDKSEEQGRQNLKVTMNTLHRILEPERQGHNPFFVERNTYGYGLVNLENFRVDADEFALQARIGFKYFKEGKYVLAKEILEDALELYSGGFLLDIDEGVLQERECFKKMYLEVAEKLATLYLQEKQLHRCLEICEKMISQDNCCESAYRMMISCYCQLKQKTLAVQTFNRYKDNLAKELSIKPSQELFMLLKEKISCL
jgi:ATP/maltotriose-dependent transcriptional regulator MalT/DNA-binding SARP family transcriptional activator